ncbi:MAG: nitroreductase family protein [Negativicutes bacterium]|nr:nitroreductase family protein [Negativicutes bacterium]
MIRDLVLRNRSYRRFFEEHVISRETLLELVDLGRLTPSGGNKQPLKYILSCDKAKNARIFPTLLWAGYLADWPGPVEGERPSAYVIVLQDKNIGASMVDHGISCQSMLLGAVEQGLGGCMLNNVKREELKKELNIPDHLDILLVVALGKPKETVVLDEVAAGADIKYWRDGDKVHHVPKRKLADVIVDL